jgi:1,4-alpha-glucan branching enzyme
MAEYRVDGFRQDSVSNIRGIDGQGTVPGGKELLVRMNETAKKTLPSSVLIAEDLKGYDQITSSFGFDTQWDGFFHWAVTSAATSDAPDIGKVRDAILGTLNGDPFDRLLYIESHDTAGNDGQRLPVRIDAANPTSLAARRRAMLAAGVLFTVPGVPMAFMGQEMHESTKFTPNAPPLDWTKAETNAGVRTFYRDMIRLRRNADGGSAALLAKNVSVTHLNDAAPNKVIAYRRWSSPGDDLIVVANFGAKSYARYDVGLPAGGAWKARVDGNDVRYGADLGSAAPTPVTVLSQARDGLPFTGAIALGPYSIVVLGR